MHSERKARSKLRGQASESDVDASLHVEDSPWLAAGSFNVVNVLPLNDKANIINQSFPDF